MVIGAIAISEAAVAQPSISSGWFNSNLSTNRCADTTSAALSALGFTNIQRTAVGVGGHYGDYAASVTCATAKGVIAVNVAGPDGHITRSRPIDHTKNSEYSMIGVDQPLVRTP